VLHKYTGFTYFFTSSYLAYTETQHKL